MSKIDASIIKIATDYVKKVQDNNINVQGAYIFGSYARGEAKEGSDLDVAIVSDSFGQNTFDERLLLMKIDKDTSSPIEPHPFSPSDMNDKYNFLSREVLRTGIKIA